MKQLVWSLVLPLAIISFAFVTKLWYVETPNFNAVLKGFPFPYYHNGLHTSLSLQIFVLELILNVFIHFSFWFIVVLNIVKFCGPFQVPRFVKIPLLIFSGLTLAILLLSAGNPDNRFSLKRNYDIHVTKREYRFFS